MQVLGIIGGSGLTRLQTLQVERQEIVTTPYGEPSAPLTFGRLDDRPVAFLPRHGPGHALPPHRVNYRANLWALKSAGVERVVGMAAVGGITAPLAPGLLCVPDQVIDYTWGRDHTLFETDLASVTHVDGHINHGDHTRIVRRILVDAPRSDSSEPGVSTVGGRL